MPNSESEHIERLRELLKRYQFYLFAGLALVLTTVVGFTYQHSAFDQTRDVANDALFSLLENADEEDKESVAADYQSLQEMTAFPEMRNLGAFTMISVHVAEKNYDAAATALQEVIDTTKDDGLRYLALLRLAEVWINNGKYDEAITLLEENKPPGGVFPILFMERIGDAAFAGGDHRAAQKAYQDAVELSHEAQMDSHLSMLFIKIGSLLSAENGGAATNNASDNGEDGEDGKDADGS